MPYLARTLLFLLSTGLLASACQSGDGRRDIRDYYYPLLDLSDGLVYEYRSLRGDSLAPSYWYYRSLIFRDSNFLTGVNYSPDLLPAQFIREEMVANGMELRDMYLYETDSSGTQTRVDVAIEADDVFPFQVRDSGGIFLFHVRWQPLSEPGVTYTVIKNRYYLGDTTYVYKGEPYACVAFQVNELFEQDSDGVFEQQFSGVEFYAEDIGLIYYRKDIAEGLTLEYGLADRYTMEELEKKWGRLKSPGMGDLNRPQ